MIAAGTDVGNPVNKAYDQYNEDISNRWKTAGLRNKV